ncbi:MAG: VOC family protein [Solirubrobacteraceae bacterium]|nr:VOC family protein [Solirubrobacteraceae bacterium]
MSEFIKRMGHVALHVPDLEASVTWATLVMGLREVERTDGVSYLTHADCHHSLQLIASTCSGLDHIAMEAHDEAAVEDLTDRLRREGVRILSDAPQEPGLAAAVRFEGPEGHVFEVFSGMTSDAIVHTGSGVQPRKFGHPTLTAVDVHALRDFVVELLDFRLSDDIGDGTLVFLRCAVDHHGLGIVRSRVAGLHHYAWEVESLAMLGQLGDVLARNAGAFIWGPGRHGAGNNLFTYHFDPAGAVVEYYADLYQVWDESSYQPGRWSLEDGRAENLWGPRGPEELMEVATPLVGRAVTTSDAREGQRP